MTPDHEAAKRYAAYIGDMARDHACDQDDVNLSAAYLDAMARLEKAEALLRKALEGARPFVEVDCPEEEAAVSTLSIIDAALATPPSDAVKRIMAMERVCEGARKIRVECSRAAGEELDAALRALRALLATTKEHGDAEKTR